MINDPEGGQDQGHRHQQFSSRISYAERRHRCRGDNSSQRLNVPSQQYYASRTEAGMR